MSTSQRTTWNGSTVEVTARLLPRKAFLAASIDVHINRETKLRTGGVFKIVGEYQEQVELSGSHHKLALAWGKAAPRSFPVKLTIDDRVVLEESVRISNWYAAYWPWALVVSLLLWLQLR